MKLKEEIKKLKYFLILWSTQSLSQLGSSMTAFALTLWLYKKTGSALNTAALSICSYTPYVLMSIFAGALTDRFDKKKTMLICDTLAACCTVAVLIMFITDTLQVWHLYLINAVLGLMNTVQNPASEVALTLIVPKELYQRTSGLQSLSRSLISILNPIIATAVYSLLGLTAVLIVDLSTFSVAFLALLLFIKLPKIESETQENFFSLVKGGIEFLKHNGLVLNLILFLSGVNLVASAFDAALPAFVIPNPRGGDTMLGVVTSFAGVAMVAGSLLVSVLPKPKNRVRVVYLTMLFSLGTENFLLAFSRNPVLWCIGQVIGWLLVPVMDASLSVTLRNSIPVELQGRVYACRNSLQYFTIPIGLFLGGLFIDEAAEPFMARFTGGTLMNTLFGVGKGSGAALVLFVLGVAGVVMCLLFGIVLKKYKYREE